MRIVWPQGSSTNPWRRSEGKSNTNIASSQNISLVVEGPLKIVNPLNIANIVRAKCARVNKIMMRIRRTYIVINESFLICFFYSVCDHALSRKTSFCRSETFVQAPGPPISSMNCSTALSGLPR
jgi:hypothetical protein